MIRIEMQKMPKSYIILMTWALSSALGLQQVSKYLFATLLQNKLIRKSIFVRVYFKAQYYLALSFKLS